MTLEVLGEERPNVAAFTFGQVAGFESAIQLAAPMFPEVAPTTWALVRKHPTLTNLTGPLNPADVGMLALSLQRLRWR